jgi:hypothetical protein
MTDDEARFFALGKKAGREEVIDELCRLLRLDERLAEAIAHHERTFHDQD